MIISTIKPLILLSLCVYHEARGESLEGQKAVVHIVLNRVARRAQSVEQVIYDEWQFSWTMDDIPDYPTDLGAFFACSEAVAAAITERYNGFTLNGADHYFNPHEVLPSWAAKMTRIASIGKHVFYRS